MKRSLAVIASISLSAIAQADTVNITSQANFSDPPKKVKSSTIHLAFTPSAPIKFQIAGKTCTWVSSSSPWGSGGGAGCNYNITIDPTGNLTDATSNEKGCTESGEPMITACR